MSVVRAELLAQRVADLPHRAVGRERFPHRRKEVLGPSSGLAHPRERAFHHRSIPLGAHARGPLDLPLLGLRIQAMELDLLAGLLLDEAVDADENLVAAFEQTLVLVGRILDLVLRETLLHRRDRPAQLVHALDQSPRPLLELPRQALQEIRAAERIRRIRAARLVGENLLRAHVETTQWINENPAEAKMLVNESIETITTRALAQEVIDQAWANIEVTYDPVASSLFASAEDAFALGFLGNDEPDLSGIYALELLNSVLAELGQPAVEGG